MKTEKKSLNALQADTAVLEKPALVKSEPFLKVEEPPKNQSLMAWFNENPAYQYKWKIKSKMANNRSGIWKTVDKTHPDFEGMYVAVDHTPSETCFTYNELVLCCTRKETAGKVRSRLNEFNRSRDRKFKKAHEILGERLAKEGSRGLSRTTSNEVDGLGEELIKE